jgi:hypothetical protein
MLSKKWWIIIAGVVIIALGLGLGLGLGLRGGGVAVDLSSPKATVQSVLDAYEDKDADRMADCCHFPLTWEGDQYNDRGEFVSMAKAVFAEIESIDISNLNISIIAQSDTTATVEATFHLKVVAEGIPFEVDVADGFELEKTGDSWYITSQYEV